MQSNKLILLGPAFALLMLMLFLLTGCQTMGSAGINTVGTCTIFKPITWSKQDTLETAKQVVEHNAAWKSVCGK